MCKVKTLTGRLNLISGYFQCAHEVEPYLQHLQSVIDEVRGEDVLICIDSNAHSPEKYSGEEDEKDRTMMDFIIQNSLIIHNKRFQPSTHKSDKNIDLTLSTASVARSLESWIVLPDGTISDHNLILFKITVDQDHQPREINKYSTKSPNFEAINQTLSDEVMGLQRMQANTIDDIEDLAEAYQRALIRSCDQNLKKVKIREKNSPWWNPKLTRLRTEMA